MCAGVHLSLRGVIYANNSTGETDTIFKSGLQCITDKTPTPDGHMHAYGTQQGMIKQYHVAALSERRLATLQTRKSEVHKLCVS